MCLSKVVRGTTERAKKRDVRQSQHPRMSDWLVANGVWLIVTTNSQVLWISGSSASMMWGLRLCSWKFAVRDCACDWRSSVINVYNFLNPWLLSPHRLSQKSIPLKLLAIFSLRIKYLSEIVPLWCQYICTHIYCFWLIYLNIYAK